MNRILVIEDDTTALRQIAQLFALEGFSVDEASSGQEGIARAMAAPPDLIVCDIMMPGTDGFGVLQALRNKRETALAPFIFLTAKAGAHDVRQGMSEGADDYITKPFEAEALLASAKQRLARHRMHVEEAERLAVRTGMLAAAAVPREMESSLAHVERLSAALGARCAADPRLLEVRAAIAGEVSNLRRLSRRLSLYAELPRLYAGRFSAECGKGVQYSPEAVTPTAQSAAKDFSRLDDLLLNLCDVPVPVTSEALAVITYELVSNACKFSAPGTAIEVETIQQRAFWTMTVRDRGRGMAPEQIATIGAFKQFWNEEERPAGLGLGLVLVQGLVRLHSGEFSIESEVNRGTVVSVMLPGSE
jgi:two-component system, sensor histidine kinase and response regulator